MSTVFLSAIVLCHNEENVLLDCIQSLSFCDEIIIANDGSTDGSVKLARQQGTKIIDLSPDDSYAQKRNQALKHASGEWILFIDADEIVSAKLAQEIVTVMANTTANGFYIARRDIFLRKRLAHGETGNTWLLRLGRRGTGVWRRKVHELWNIQGKIDRIAIGEIEHNPHPTLSSFFEKVNRYTSLEIEERFSTYTHRSYMLSLLELLVFPPGKFLYNYVALSGFLDGIEGFIHAYCMSIHSLLVRIKTVERIRSHLSL